MSGMNAEYQTMHVLVVFTYIVFEMVFEMCSDFNTEVKYQHSLPASKNFCCKNCSLYCWKLL